MIERSKSTFAFQYGWESQQLNPYMTNGLAHHYHLGQATFIFRGTSSDFEFLSHFLMKFPNANRIAPDGIIAPMSHTKDARLK